MEFLTDPFQPTFMQRGLLAGLLAGLSCGIVGVWVVVRRVALIGDALAHGIIPGVAIAYLLGAALPLGAAISGAAMVLGVRAASNLRRVGEDTGIGLLFAGMLALGVLIISRSRSFATDVSHILFGDPLGVGTGDLILAGATAAFVLLIAALGHRAFVALSFDARKAQMLGLRPGLARTVVLLLVAATIVASFQAVGALLVFALLVAPAATAGLLVRRASTMMVLAVLLSWSAVTIGMIASFHYSLATGAAIAMTAVLQFFLVATLDLLRLRHRGRTLQSNGNGNQYQVRSQPQVTAASDTLADAPRVDGKAPL